MTGQGVGMALRAAIGHYRTLPRGIDTVKSILGYMQSKDNKNEMLHYNGF